MNGHTALGLSLYYTVLSPSGPWQDGRTSETAVLRGGTKSHTLVAVYSGDRVALLHPH